MKKILLGVVCLAVIGGGAFAGWRFTRPHNRNVVLIMMDTTRADHFGSYGYPRNTTPNLDQFARENVRFSYAISAAPWTPPSVATMFTGLYPASHGCVPPNGFSNAKDAGTKLSDELVTLAEVFKKNGYSTGGVSPNPWVNPEFNFDQGFDTFWYKARVDASQINKAGMKIADNLIEKGKPFFLYLHYLDPHDPYKPPAEFRDQITGSVEGIDYAEKEQAKVNLYDAEIKYMDSSIGKMLAYFKDKGIYNDLSIVIAADHGEQFMERGHQGHGFNLYDEEVHVPFLIKTAGKSAPHVVETTVNTVDIFPTLLQMANILPPSAVAGISLLDERGLSERNGVFSEINRKIAEQRAFTTPEGLKLIVELDAEGVEHVVGLFDSHKDHKELTPISNNEMVVTMSNELKDIRQYALDSRVQSGTARGQMKDSTIEHLKSLGYLQ